MDFTRLINDVAEELMKVEVLSPIIERRLEENGIGKNTGSILFDN